MCINYTAHEYIDQADVILVGEMISFEAFDPQTYGQIVREDGVSYLANNYGGKATARADRYLLGSGPSEVRFRYNITGSGVPPDDALPNPGPPDSRNFPYLPAAVAATLGPLAFLAGAAFVWRRRVGGQ